MALIAPPKVGHPPPPRQSHPPPRGVAGLAANLCKYTRTYVSTHIRVRTQTYIREQTGGRVSVHVQTRARVPRHAQKQDRSRAHIRVRVHMRAPRARVCKYVCDAQTCAVHVQTQVHVQMRIRVRTPSRVQMQADLQTPVYIRVRKHTRGQSPPRAPLS